MKKAALYLVFAIVICSFFLGRTPPQANADKAFRDEFVAVYVKADSDKPDDKAFAAVVDKAKCNICHVGKVKKNRNNYGKALGELLSRKTDAEDKEKIQAALKKIESLHSNPKDDKSPTFIELIRSGKLPGGQPKAGS
jgi:hypothetical protein